MEPLSTTFAKAVDDLSASIFIPALISSYLVEFGPSIQKYTGFGLLLTYLTVLIFGSLSACLVIIIIIYAGIFFFNGRDIGPYIGVAIMPLGFAGLFPEQFANLNIPYSQVTGVAILAWAFMHVSFGVRSLAISSDKHLLIAIMSDARMIFFEIVGKVLL